MAPSTLDRGTREPASAQVGASVLRVTGVAKAFHRGIWPMRRSVQVLSGATLEVGPGELVGLVGENGSGKSTLLQIVVGLLGRDSGSVERPDRLGYCPQLPMLWDKLTVDEHFALFARAYGMDDDARRRAVGATPFLGSRSQRFAMAMRRFQSSAAAASRLLLPREDTVMLRSERSSNTRKRYFLCVGF